MVLYHEVVTLHPLQHRVYRTKRGWWALYGLRRDGTGAASLPTQVYRKKMCRRREVRWASMTRAIRASQRDLGKTPPRPHQCNDCAAIS